MTEVRQGATPCVHFRDVRFNEVSVKELTVYRSNDIYNKILLDLQIAFIAYHS